MSDGHVPRVFVSYAQDSEAHQERVRQLMTFLRGPIGLDAHMDAWYDGERRDWSLWAVEQLRSADFVLVIASPEYKRRAEGTAPPNVGNGSQFEAAMIRNDLTRNLGEQLRRILPVVLPGGSIADIPIFLNPHSTTRFHVPELTREGVADLLAAITGRSRHPMPPRGIWRAGTDDDRASPRLMPDGPEWSANGDAVSAGVADIDGVRYDESIVFRPPPGTTQLRGIVNVQLNGAYQDFSSVIGVLDDAVDAFQVGQFHVYVDGRPCCQGKVACGKPTMVDLNVAGAIRLRLEMFRPSVRGTAPPGEVSRRLPELAWGNPTFT
jgi:hypothetical protein